MCSGEIHSRTDETHYMTVHASYSLILSLNLPLFGTHCKIEFANFTYTLHKNLFFFTEMWYNDKQIKQIYLLGYSNIESEDNR